jgi:hypothetical protein
LVTNENGAALVHPQSRRPSPLEAPADGLGARFAVGFEAGEEAAYKAKGTMNDIDRMLTR